MAHCAAVQTLDAGHLLGTWLAEITGQPGVARLQFDKDPEQDDSVVGSITRANQAVAQVAGDLQQGEFNLEESDDGTRISATWAGQIDAATCGKEIKGLWTNVNNDQTYAFVLRKQAAR